MSVRGFTTLLRAHWHAERVRDAVGENGERPDTLDVFLRFEHLTGYCRVHSNHDHNEFRGVRRVAARLQRGTRITLGTAAENEIRSRTTSARFRRIPELVAGLPIEWHEAAEQGSLLGVLRIDDRQQPFTLFLRSAGLRQLVRCVSPVGKVTGEAARGVPADWETRSPIARVAALLDADAMGRSHRGGRRRAGSGSQRVHVSPDAGGAGFSLTSRIAPPRVVRDLMPGLVARFREQKRLSELVGYRLDRRERLVGESWVPAAGLSADEWAFHVRTLANACDRLEFVLTGVDAS